MLNFPCFRISFVLAHLMLETFGMNIGGTREVIRRINQSIINYPGCFNGMARYSAFNLNGHKYTILEQKTNSHQALSPILGNALCSVSSTLLKNKVQNVFMCSNSIDSKNTTASTRETESVACTNAEYDQATNHDGFSDSSYTGNSNYDKLLLIEDDYVNYWLVEGSNQFGTKKMEQYPFILSAGTNKHNIVNKTLNTTQKESTLPIRDHAHLKETTGQQVIKHPLVEESNHIAENSLNTINISPDALKKMNRIKPYEFDKFVPLKHDEEVTDRQNDYLQNISTNVHPDCVFLFSKSMTGRISFEYLSQEWWLELKNNKESLKSFLLHNNRYFTAEHRSRLYVYSHSVHKYFEYIPNLYNKAVWGYVKHNVMIISYNQFLVNLFDFLNCLCVRDDLTVEIVDDKFKQLDEQISILNNNLEKMKDIISKIS